MVAARSNAAARMPRRGTPSLSNKSRGGGGSIVVKLVFLALIGGAGYFGWKQFVAYKARPRPVPPPVKQVVVEEPDPEPPKPVVKPKPKPVRKRRLTEFERDEELIRQAEEEERRKKALENDPAEIARRQAEALKRQQEADARARARFDEAQTARKAAEDKVAEARKDASSVPLSGLKGIRFGSVQEGVPSVWGSIYSGDSVDKSGVTFAVYGAEVANPIGSLGKSPLVWVTPKTRRVFRVEFFRAINRTPKNRHDPETASLAEMMQKTLKREPIVTRSSTPDLPGVEYVFPVGDTTLRVGEYGDELKVIAEHEGLRKEAKAESDQLRAAKAADTSEDDLLVSTSYPQGPAVNYKNEMGPRFREGTPKAFCGLIFGRLPPESATIVNPKNGEKGFFLDYGRAKCPAFKGFTVGKADIDRYRGGLFAVTLYNSEGGQQGLDDAAYFKSVREALDRQYLVKPEEKKGTREFPELVYHKGDVSITFGPEHNGGFRLRGENHVLADISKMAPTPPVSKRRR